jgi:hypothetical protein
VELLDVSTVHATSDGLRAAKGLNAAGKFRASTLGVIVGKKLVGGLGQAAGLDALIGLAEELVQQARNGTVVPSRLGAALGVGAVKGIVGHVVVSGAVGLAVAAGATGLAPVVVGVAAMVALHYTFEHLEDKYHITDKVARGIEVAADAVVQGSASAVRAVASGARAAASAVGNAVKDTVSGIANLFDW